VRKGARGLRLLISLLSEGGTLDLLKRVSLKKRMFLYSEGVLR